MSWSIQKKGAPAKVLAETKAETGVWYMPDGLLVVIEGLLMRAQENGKSTVTLSTNGHVHNGIGEVHLTIALAVPTVAEEPKEDTKADST